MKSGIAIKPKLIAENGLLATGGGLPNRLITMLMGLFFRNYPRMIAELRYTALGVDMYGDGKTAMHPDDAGKFSSELMKNIDLAKTRFLAATDFLKQQPIVDPTRTALPAPMQRCSR